MIIARSHGSRTTRLCRAAAVNSDLVTDGYVLSGGHFHLLFFLSDDWCLYRRDSPLWSDSILLRRALVVENMKMVE
jgi:hypothetical protein